MAYAELWIVMLSGTCGWYWAAAVATGGLHDMHAQRSQVCYMLAQPGHCIEAGQQCCADLGTMCHALCSELGGSDLTPMSLGLSHSLSRYKLKFSPEKVDTMIVQV